MSLGGYTAALTATVESELDFLVPLVPLACLADFAREQGRLSAHPLEAEREHALLAQTYRVTSPLALPPRIAPRRVLVVGARADRVTPVAHARKLAAMYAEALEAMTKSRDLYREAAERAHEALAAYREAEAKGALPARKPGRMSMGLPLQQLARGFGRLKDTALSLRPGAGADGTSRTGTAPLTDDGSGTDSGTGSGDAAGPPVWPTRPRTGD